MAKIDILIEGYTTEDNKDEEEKTISTITLVQDDGFNIIVDPGVLESQEVLIGELKKRGLGVNDINLVFITHSHIDHYRNIGMFPEAKTLEFFGLWDKNMVQDWEEDLTSDIKIIKTPGHSSDGLTMLVKTDAGVVAICGDVFWKELLPEVDPYASNMKKLLESRKKILEIADFIIPGHGGMFKVDHKDT